MCHLTDKNTLASSSVDNEAETSKHNSSPDQKEEVEPVAGPSNPTPIVENMNEYELNDDSDNDVVSIYDNPATLAEDVNEYAFDSDCESGVNQPDMYESRPLDKKYLGKITRNPALTYMLEYSDLTQNQIMHLINHNNDESHKNTNKSARTSEKDTRSELVDDSNSVDNESASLTLVENCADASKAVELTNTRDARLVKDSSSVEFIPSSPESDNFVEVKPVENTAETSGFTAASRATSSNDETIPEKRAIAESQDDVTQADTSDSASDDFIEIHDVPIPDVDVSRSTARKENIEITIKSDEKLEDDMFADIFGKTDRTDVTSAICAKQIKSTGTNDERRTALAPEDDNDVKKLDTITEEPITEKTENKLPENIESIQNASSDETKAHDTLSPDKLTGQDNMNSEAASFNEHVQEKPIVLPTNEEGWIELKVYFM